MKYQVGAKIICKKPHACGSSEWEITRVGADVKIKCLGCGRIMFFSPDQIEKMTKKYIQVDKIEGQDE